MLEVLGARLTPELKQRYAKSPQWNGGGFVNESPTHMEIGLKEAPALMVKMLSSPGERAPRAPLPTQKINPATIGGLDTSQTRVHWLGHSAVLLEMGGMVILLDPMMGDVPAPVPIFGRKRFAPGLPISIADLPEIDIVLMSHDHYDHLDYGSVKQLIPKVKKWVTSLGVGRHLEQWGIKAVAITELDWHEATEINGLEFRATPARHFSGRSVGDRATTLWSSWVITTDSTSIFFNADSGYDDHFKRIGEQYGPFDLALMECGQYNKQWHAIHMFPDESAQAAVDLNAKVAMPIHWGAFTLAFHSWKEPPEHFVNKADELGLTTATPRIGEPLVIGGSLPQERWWRDHE